MANTLPTEPFDGMLFVDSYGVRWVYNAELDLWQREGSVSQIPLADRATVGQLAAADKRLIDAVPAKGGGFGLIVRPLLSVAASGNPDGVIYGDVELVSDSLDLECVDGEGQVLSPKCKVGLTPDGAPAPGINLKVSQKFLNSLCFEIPGCPGPRGGPGQPGAQGRPGTGDGPAGEKGAAGQDATTAAKFTGVKTIDLDEIRDVAVAGLELSPEEGILSVVKARMKVASEDVPADRVVVSPIVRSLEFTGNEFQYNIQRPEGDVQPADVTLLHYPKGFEPGGDVKEIDLTASPLSGFVGTIIDFYRGELEKLAEKYDQQIRDHIVQKDGEARQQLNILAEELANCEFQLPIETCMGISPQDCGGGPPNTALATFLFGDKYKDGADAKDLGEFDIPTGGGRVPVIIKEDGGQNFYSNTLPEGDYVLQYVGGTSFDQQDQTVGYFVGLSAPDVGLRANVVATGTAGNVTLKWPETSEAHDKFDAKSTEDAYLNGPVLEKIVTVSLDRSGGEVTLQTDAPSNVGTGAVKVRVVRFSVKGHLQVDADVHLVGSGA